MIIIYLAFRSGSDEDYTIKHQLLTDVIEQIDSRKEEEKKAKEREAEKRKKTSVQPSTSTAPQKGKFTSMDIRLENMWKGLFRITTGNKLAQYARFSSIAIDLFQVIGPINCCHESDTTAINLDICSNYSTIAIDMMGLINCYHMHISWYNCQHRVLLKQLISLPFTINLHE